MWNVVCVVYDTTSGKSSLGISHGKIRDFACRIPLMNLVALMGILKVLRCATTSIPTGLISARMTYLCKKFKIPKRADGTI